MLKYTVLLLTLLAIAKVGIARKKSRSKVTKDHAAGADIESKTFVKINTSYYFFGTESLNWYAAYEECRKLDSELVTLETDEEFDAVADYLISKKLYHFYWTSGNDLAKTGKEIWFTSGEPVTSLRWGAGQPDNSDGKEHCIHLRYKTDPKRFDLNDFPCSDEIRYICEPQKWKPYGKKINK